MSRDEQSGRPTEVDDRSENQAVGRGTDSPATVAEPAGESMLVPIGEVARALGVSVATVRRWDAAGQIQSVRTPGGQRRFPRTEVDRLLTPTP